MGLIDQKSRMMRRMLDGLLPYVRDPREAAKITRAQAEASLEDAITIVAQTSRGMIKLERPEDLQKIQGHTVTHVWLEEACALDKHDFWSRGVHNGFGGGGGGHDHRIDIWGYGAGGGASVPPPVSGGGGCASPSPEAEMARTEMVMHLEGMIAHTRARQRVRWSVLWQRMESLFTEANARDRMAVSLTEMLEHAFNVGVQHERDSQARQEAIRKEVASQKLRDSINATKQETVNRLSTVAKMPHES
jgi:hypothetical protein